MLSWKMEAEMKAAIYCAESWVAVRFQYSNNQKCHVNEKPNFYHLSKGLEKPGYQQDVWWINLISLQCIHATGFVTGLLQEHMEMVRWV